MLVCTRCAIIGIETDGSVWERHGRTWRKSTKGFSQPTTGICDHCHTDLTVEAAEVEQVDEWDKWAKKMEQAEKEVDDEEDWDIDFDRDMRLIEGK